MKHLSMTTAMAVLIVSTAFCANSEPTAGGSQPRIETSDGKLTVVLPDPVLRSVAAAYPTCRIPGQPEIEGQWQIAIERRPYPYVTWGDYDGDGLVDVVLILVCKDGWRLVVSRQMDGRTFTSQDIFGERTDDPTNWYLATFKKGQERPREVFDEASQEMRVAGKYKFGTDALEAYRVKEGSILFHWVGGKFERISIGYE